MRLHEAIETAGEGGRGKLPPEGVFGITNEFEIDSSGVVHFQLPLKVTHIRSCRWEVVEDKVIEVGDTVEYKYEYCSTKGKVVYASDAYVRWLTEDGCSDACARRNRNLTLVRKGPKVHTFEGVAVCNKGRINKPDGGTGWELLDLPSIAGNGKTYRMTLTEVTP